MLGVAVALGQVDAWTITSVEHVLLEKLERFGIKV
jgi:hypothetical protein